MGLSKRGVRRRGCQEMAQRLRKVAQADLTHHQYFRRGSKKWLKLAQADLTHHQPIITHSGKSPKIEAQAG